MIHWQNHKLVVKALGYSSLSHFSSLKYFFNSADSLFPAIGSQAVEFMSSLVEESDFGALCLEGK